MSPPDTCNWADPLMQIEVSGVILNFPSGKNGTQIGRIVMISYDFSAENLDKVVCLSGRREPKIPRNVAE